MKKRWIALALVLGVVTASYLGLRIAHRSVGQLSQDSEA